MPLCVAGKDVGSLEIGSALNPAQPTIFTGDERARLLRPLGWRGTRWTSGTRIPSVSGAFHPQLPR